MALNLSDLLKRAQRQELITSSELAEVIRLIETNKGGDVYSLVEILGRAGCPEHKTLMEGYLHRPDDTQLSALALNVLCRWWGLIGEYRGKLIYFLKGVDWDPGGYTQLQALSIAGEYLRENKDDEMLKNIYMVFSNENERAIIRSAAYSALCRADGCDWHHMPPASRIVDFSKEINRSVIARVESKLRDALH